MMEIPIYQVDAFTNKSFGGNPAAVCPLTDWLPDETLQHIAGENNLSETAFLVPRSGGYTIRWFTPTVEVDLCGHATLASAWVVFNRLGFTGDVIHFQSPRSGALPVRREGQFLTLDFPSDVVQEVKDRSLLNGCFDREPLRVFRGRTDFMLEYAAEADVRNIRPDFRRIAQLNARGVIVTAPGDRVDFVSRFFGPACGVDEDPVTGSAHTTLAPFWADRFGRTALTAQQVSARVGDLRCRISGDRTEISGEAVLFMEGIIRV